MPYENDPLQSEISKHFTLRNGVYYYREPRFGELQIGDDDVWLASETFRGRGRIAKALNFLLMGSAIAYIFWNNAIGNPIGWTWLAFPAAFLCGILIHFAVMSSATRPFRKRLLEQTGARRRGLRRAWRELRSFHKPMLVLVALYAGIFCYVLWGYFHRADLIDHGETTHAVVTLSDKPAHRKQRCRVAYSFQWMGRSYAGEADGCPFQAQHPVGTSLTIYFDPDDPMNSLPAGLSKWPNGAVYPFYIFVGAVILFALLLCLSASSLVPTKGPMSCRAKSSRAAREGL